ncbi:MAG: 6-aminohexanoate hydrolase [Rhodovulum sulfidophilum]|uniref:6-aminohexanoate hydrolase n=1 Tax=Rhodovulum sulfidophilum TaxID=35806 RepID=A0A2W5PZM4_RHOSU|nr:MAG: 6-aminohexanoate hydrolase [Rhodovulum sulfidophilum]
MSLRPSFPRRALLAALAAAPILPTALRAQGARRLDLDSREIAIPDQLHALIVLRDGEERVARAFGGPGLDRPANVKSVSKTLVATLTGCAVARGVLAGPDVRALPLLGRRDEGPYAGLTVADLLSLQGGAASTSGASYGAWVSSRDWVGFVLDQPRAAPPGDGFIYSTGTTHLLGAVLAEASGRSLLALARDWLGDPLGIEVPPWVRDPEGYYLGGNEMALSPRALARFGAMILAGGAWQGAEVVPGAWIERSWEPRARSPFSGDQYGWGWFLTRFGGAEAAYARGYGGQMLVVIPSRATVVAITSDPTLPARSGGYFSDLRDLIEAVV